MIEIENLKKSFDIYNSILLRKISSKLVLKDVSFKINKGDVVGVIGKNGSGKSTLLKILFGSIEADSGSLKLYGDEKKYKEFIKNSSLINSNDRSFFWRLSLEENLDYFKSIYGSEEKEEFRFLKDDLNLLDLYNRNFSTLSSGEKKKAILYRALLKDPELILFDEFTQSLDLPTKKSIESLIKSLVKDYKKTIIWVTHDLNEIMSLCNKLLILNKGLLTFHDLKNIGTNLNELEELIS
tara:strand:+ start:736 stop:1452 length:717 start_codon:yes stop_codon:yes gene_type:complete